jgi:hypothetical protein
MYLSPPAHRGLAGETNLNITEFEIIRRMGFFARARRNKARTRAR